MRANIINGKQAAEQILDELTRKVQNLKTHPTSPTLAIVLVGDNPASVVYVGNKLKALARTNMQAIQINLSESTTTIELISHITKLNEDPTVSGIIVQLPLPKHINQTQISLSINPDKDVDGLHPLNLGYLYSGSNRGFVPPTALGCLTLIKSCITNLSGKHAVVVGRSHIVGRPLAALLLKEDCTVTICHSKTENLSSITSKADIVIAAIGIPYKFTAEYFNPNSVVIDVGITRLPNQNQLAGDVDFLGVCDKVAAITPVPGGVGPMTVAFLLANSLLAYCRHHNLEL